MVVTTATTGTVGDCVMDATIRDGMIMITSMGDSMMTMSATIRSCRNHVTATGF
jgi:hypothetical protein